MIFFRYAVLYLSLIKRVVFCVRIFPLVSEFHPKIKITKTNITKQKSPKLCHFGNINFPQKNEKRFEKPQKRICDWIARFTFTILIQHCNCNYIVISPLISFFKKKNYRQPGWVGRGGVNRYTISIWPLKPLFCHMTCVT